ncbi:MAG: hypothetical protein ACYSU5_18965 [Planctomycetota bacterium]
MKGFVTKCGGLKLLVIAALVLATCGIVVAAEANEETDKKEVLTSLEQQMLKTISITFRDTPIDDVIRAIAEKANVGNSNSDSYGCSPWRSPEQHPCRTRLWLCS